MKILDRYIARTVIIWTAIALLVLMSLRLFNHFVDESGDAGDADFTVINAVQVTLLKSPGFMIEVFPVAALLGGLLALGGMARHAELTAIRAAGVSVWRILGSVLLAGLLLVATVGVLSEYVVPVAEQKAELFKAERMNQPSILHTRHGYWLRDGNRFVNIRKVFPGGALGNVFIYELDDDWQLRTMTYAKDGVYEDGIWKLSGIRRAIVSLDKVRVERQREWASPLTIQPAFLDLVAIKPDVMSAFDLYQYLEFLEENEQSRPEYEVALWNKITIPVNTLILLVLAVAFVLGNLRNVDIGQRILAGAVTGTVFVMLNRAASFTALVYEVPPVLAAWAPALTFLAVTLFYMKRLR